MNYRKPVWIDTDISIDHKYSDKEYKDVDDALALISLINSKTIDIKGISSTFGNTDSTHSYKAAKKLVKKFGDKNTQIYKGANKPISQKDLPISDASKAIAKALEKDNLKILSLGSATNIAVVIQKYPQLVDQIDEIIAMAGSRRTPNDHFFVGPKQKKPFDAVNFEADVEAWKIILDSNIPITFIPFETSHKVWITKDDIDQIADGGKSGEYLEPYMIKCVNQWKKEYGCNGFNPFDTLAAGYLLAPYMFNINSIPASIEEFPSDTIVAKNGKKPKLKPYLFVSKKFKKSRRVNYCSSVSEEFKPYLIDTLRGSFQISLDVVALSHVNVIVDDIEKATEFYQRTLGFKIACNKDGQINFQNYQSPAFAKDAGFLDGKVRVDVRFLKHPQAGIYLELMKYYYPKGNHKIKYKNTNDMSGVGHIALEVTNAKKVFKFLKQQPDVKMINPSKKYGPPKKLDNFEISFFYWLDPYGIQWEMEEGRPVNYGIITG